MLNKTWDLKCSWGKHDTVQSVFLIFKFAFIYVFEAQQLSPHLTEELLVCSLPLLTGGCIPSSTTCFLFFSFFALLLKEHSQGIREDWPEEVGIGPKHLIVSWHLRKNETCYLVRLVMFSLFPEHTLSWAAVHPGSPFVTKGTR